MKKENRKNPDGKKMNRMNVEELEAIIAAEPNSLRSRQAQKKIHADKYGC